MSSATEPSLGIVGTILSGLRELPIWLLSGLAIAAYVVLFIPMVGTLDLSEVRRTWGVWIWMAALTLTVLTVTRAIDAIAAKYIVHRKEVQARRALRLVPRLRQRW